MNNKSTAAEVLRALLDSEMIKPEYHNTVVMMIKGIEKEQNVD